MTEPAAPELPVISVERCERITETELMELCEATNAAIIEGGGFGWLEPQGQDILMRHFRGVLLVPERELFLAKLNGRVVGSAQLVRPPRNNEAQAIGAQLTHAYVAPYARGIGLARALVRFVEDRAAALGHRVLNLDVRETQLAAIQIFEALGYTRWGTHPAYARVKGRTVKGHFFLRVIEAPGRKGA